MTGVEKLIDAMKASGCRTFGEYLQWRKARMTPEELAAHEEEAARFRAQLDEPMYCEGCGGRFGDLDVGFDDPSLVDPCDYCCGPDYCSMCCRCEGAEAADLDE